MNIFIVTSGYDHGEDQCNRGVFGSELEALAFIVELKLEEPDKYYEYDIEDWVVITHLQQDLSAQKPTIKYIDGEPFQYNEVGGWTKVKITN